MTSVLNLPSGITSTTVRQTPLTAIESPGGVGGDDGTADDQPCRIAEIFLADDLAQFFDNSGEHVLKASAEPGRHPLRCRHADPPGGDLRRSSSPPIALIAGCSKSDESSQGPSRRRDAAAAVRRDHQKPDERAPGPDSAGRDQGSADRVARGRSDEHPRGGRKGQGQHLVPRPAAGKASTSSCADGQPVRDANGR